MPPEFRAMVDAGHLGDLLPAVEIAYPRSAAPTANAAMDELFERFPDHEPELLVETDDEWRFRLGWTSDPLTFVDPGVAKAAASLYGLALPEIGGYREVHRWAGRDVVFSMVHAWAMLAAALAVSRRGGRPLRWVVHVDDHTDMGELALQPTGTEGVLTDVVFGRGLVLADPDSVVSAVRRGVISKGNFLTAYLLGHSGARVTHVGLGLEDGTFELVHAEEPGTLGGRSLPRGRLLRERSAIGAGRFRRSGELPVEVPAPGEGVWLDIDLDYFWNRYDGDSDKLGRQAEPGERDEVMRRVERFLAELSRAPWITAIEAVSIAVSPGFFPADHWATVIPALRDGVREILEAHPLVTSVAGVR
jgi:hypothetical protein